MIKRIVKLTFQEDKIDAFKSIFEDSKTKIRGSQGCQHVELLQSTSTPNVFFTFSIWEDEDALNAYRHSDLFKATWQKTKAIFSDKPQAWSLDFIDAG